MTPDDTLRARYDALPYPPLVHPWSHPRRLGVIGVLHGLAPAPVTACRVLELGCGTGANLVAIAADHGGVEAVGVDLSERQVAEGGALCEAMRASCQSLPVEAPGVEGCLPDSGVCE